MLKAGLIILDVSNEDHWILSGSIDDKLLHVDVWLVEDDLFDLFHLLGDAIDFFFNGVIVLQIFL